MKIVYAYVCGDILHEGHLLFLENAKALGDKLIVGVLTDEAVMEKKARPALSFRERVKLISALKCVDCAVPQNEYSPIENLKAIQPDITIESTSHIGNPYLKKLKKALPNGRIIMLPYYKNQSSTAIKNRIKKQ
ncbi:adenylyltransferase/cytidyltransferase family protein [Candidatus Woesearchaeota archaeon]|jgi:cytidyltransferase-like protein|nr:adenylyltransferase/cytidyltransferase family protein [Candidatus Woesearchaeota archaeon]MBT4368841.1 adenylyltransferase/cytidyltransferase family protein [Candidatus Woesearchaeota archaeon]MBT4712130.1 adenylyltransferase/cytidyltransferase family protein [Candidatus Woesearchaeota archaeon]MBT6639122.1 adenylyltransferase/cytidyltransferase family protein [Candidatus Woesearchaeota archaeon]MBT7134322.1 adenylyltransferase/cytidyltransferase family protein [Candidatus Woesearchaeota arc